MISVKITNWEAINYALHFESMVWPKTTLLAIIMNVVWSSVTEFVINIIDFINLLFFGLFDGYSLI